MKPYPQAEHLLRPLLQVPMPGAGRLYGPGETRNFSRASANSSSWSLKGIRYLFLLCLVMPRGPRLDASDSRWISQRAAGSPAFLRRDILPRGDEEVSPCLRNFKQLEIKRCPVPFLRGLELGLAPSYQR
jgi:hypothetical protein